METSALFRVEPTLGALEQDYRRHYLASDASQATFIMVVTVAALFLASLFDFTGSASGNAIRRAYVTAGAALGCGLVAIAVRRVHRPATLDLLVFLWSLAAAILLLYFRITQAPFANEVTIAVLALGCYTLVPNRLLLRIIPAFLLTAVDAAMFTRWQPEAHAGATLLAYGFIHLVGIWSSSTIHGLRRRQFEALIREQATLAEMQELARTDSLTGLISRRHFIELADRELARFHRYHSRLAAMIVDLDHFKSINDTWGHSAGDEVLRAFAALLSRQSRRGDLVGRLGGEEFCMVLPETSLADAEDVARRLVTSCRGLSIVVEGRPLRITVSAGVTEADPDDQEFSMVLRRADAALYAAKQNGRDRVETLPAQRASSY